MTLNIIEKIKEYNKIIILGHKRPDGDCFGSQIGLKNIIKTTFPDKEVYVTGEKASYLEFIGFTDEVADDKFKDSLVIIVDCANLERVSDTRHELASCVIKIDHHPNVEPYGDIQWVDTTYPAAALMITQLYNDFKEELKITLEGAAALYTGIVTDTGRFKYEGVSAKTLVLASTLLELGVKADQVDKNLGVETIETLKIKGYILSNFKVSKQGFAYIVITRDIIKEFNVTEEAASSQVNLLSNLENIPVWALIIETETEVRVRLRSKGPVINDLAALYNGGGHPKASGAKLTSLTQVDEFVMKCDEWITKYKEE